MSKISTRCTADLSGGAEGSLDPAFAGDLSDRAVRKELRQLANVLEQRELARAVLRITVDRCNERDPLRPGRIENCGVVGGDHDVDAPLPSDRIQHAKEQAGTGRVQSVVHLLYDEQTALGARHQGGDDRQEPQSRRTFPARPRR